MNKTHIKATAILSLLIFVTLSVTIVLMFAFTLLLVKFGIVDTGNWKISVLVLGFLSIFIGTLISILISKNQIRTVINISNATQEVTKGNFDIELDENIKATEINTMVHNFNRMIKELKNTELFRNDFIENVSHEFKTPLSAIEGYATLLQKKDLSRDKQIEYTKKILFNTKRLSSLTGNILLLSRLENQEIEVKKENYSLDEQLREIILLFEPQWTNKNLELDIELESIDYFGNKELLAQVWQNIIGNAIKFVSDNGKIRVILLRDNNIIKVLIVDNGIGMSSDVIQRIYEKFYQGDESHSTFGNGLGLALSKRIIDLHNGNIQVSSKEGKGTTFTIILPTINQYMV